MYFFSKWFTKRLEKFKPQCWLILQKSDGSTFTFKVIEIFCEKEQIYFGNILICSVNTTIEWLSASITVDFIGSGVNTNVNTYSLLGMHFDSVINIC